jgi:hypothetical protein
MRRTRSRPDAQPARSASQIELMCKARQASPDCDQLLLHALADEVAPALTDADDVSLEGVVEAAGASPYPQGSQNINTRASAAATQADGPGSGCDVAAGRHGAGTVGPLNFGSDISSSSGSSSDYSARLSRVCVGPGTDSKGAASDVWGRGQPGGATGLAVGPLLAGRVADAWYGGVPAEQHAVDVRRLEATSPVEGL